MRRGPSFGGSTRQIAGVRLGKASVTSGGVTRHAMDAETAPSPIIKADSITITVKAEPGGKLRVGCQSWDDVKIIMADEVLELACEEGQVWVRRKAKPSS
jgi:hypothetical protein